MITGQRFLSVALRKKVCCRCGCKAWCTIFGVLMCLRWSLAALVRAVYPLERHDKTDWWATDAARKTKAGAPMRRKAVLIQQKLDWSEYSSAMGFPNWRDALRPCFKCNADMSIF